MNYGLLDQFPDIVQDQIIENLVPRNTEVVIGAVDEVSLRRQGLVYDSNTLRPNNGIFLSSNPKTIMTPGVRMAMRSSDRIWYNFVRSISLRCQLVFSSMLALHNFLRHVNARYGQHGLNIIRRISLRQMRGVKAMAALEYLERCCGLDELRPHYCKVCFETRTGPGKINTTAVSRKWRNLRFAQSQIGARRPPRRVIPTRGRSREQCRACELKTREHRRNGGGLYNYAYTTYILTTHNAAPFIYTLVTHQGLRRLLDSINPAPGALVTSGMWH